MYDPRPHSRSAVRNWGSDPGLAAALLLDLARLELVTVDADGKIAAVDAWDHAPTS